MPIEEGAGCLAVILRVLGGLAEVLLETSHLGDVCGYFYSWTMRLVTFGRYKPDPESWEAVIIGIVMLIGLLIFAGKMW